jgi:hypothetical protein
MTSKESAFQKLGAFVRTMWPRRVRSGPVLTRIPQREPEDCLICTVAMVLGYSYERVLSDSQRYPQQLDGKYDEWWVDYIQHQGRRVVFRPTSEAHDLVRFPKATVGILGITFYHLKRRHVVALDSMDVLDPRDGQPDHMRLADYMMLNGPDGFDFDSEFLVITWAEYVAGVSSQSARSVGALRANTHGCRDFGN